MSWTLWIASLTLAAPDAPAVEFALEQTCLRIAVDGAPFARYVFRDPAVLRPYFCDVHAPGGLRVTRRHPPAAGEDPDDHPAMHPGIWLAFGDIGGVDFWRNAGRVEHAGFVEAPAAASARGAFAVRNRYLGPDGAEVCGEVAHYTVEARAGGTLLSIDTAIGSDARDVVFGDQEEMGLGLRVHTPLSVKHGQGAIANAEGGRNEAGVWGKPSAWCAYGSGAAGACLIPHPGNFRASWFHARDYGLLVANPFGAHAFTGGPASAVRVARGERLRLRFRVWVYAGAAPPAQAIAAIAAAEPAP